MTVKSAIQVFVGAMLLTAFAMVVASGQAQGAPRALGPDKLSLIEAKEQELRAAGVPRLKSNVGPFAGPDSPITLFDAVEHTTRAELLKKWQEQWDRSQQYFDSLERDSGKAAADLARSKMLAERAQIERLPDGRVDRTIPGAHVGYGSIQFSTMIYDCCVAKDPTNVMFYRVGTAADVDYDLRNWTTIRWSDTNCRNTLQAFIWDAQHTGGQDAWRNPENYDLENDAGACGTARYHVRLFQSWVQDSHGQFGWWTMSGVHHDNAFHTCVDNWMGARDRLRDSFKDANGNNLWFVASIWSANFGNAGNYECAYHDGIGWYIELSN